MKQMIKFGSPEVTNCQRDKCQPEGTPQQDDSQEHSQCCSKLKLVDNNILASSKVAHADIYIYEAAVSVFKELLDQRNKLLQEEAGTTSRVWTRALNSAV